MTCRNHSTRDRILAAAEKLFAEKGYKETTTREIVREAGASLSSLQSHFQGKESVYFQVRCKAIEELYQFMRPSMEDLPGVKSFNSFASSSLSFFMCVRKIHALPSRLP